MKGLFTILGGLGVGAAIMYLFDPQEGNRRRSVLKDKATGYSNGAQKVINDRVQDLSNRARGYLSEAKSTFGEASHTAHEQNIQ